MTRVHPLIRRIGQGCQGSVAVEFGLLAPVFIGMLLGILQIGLGMQSYNALRNVAADAARYALVESQKTVPTDMDAFRADVDDWTTDRATAAPYLLDNGGLTVGVVVAPDQRVEDATELTITMTYQIPSIMTMMGWESPSITFERTIFV